MEQLVQFDCSQIDAQNFEENKIISFNPQFELKKGKLKYVETYDSFSESYLKSIVVESFVPPFP